MKTATGLSKSVYVELRGDECLCNENEDFIRTLEEGHRVSSRFESERILSFSCVLSIEDI